MSRFPHIPLHVQATVFAQADGTAYAQALADSMAVENPIRDTSGDQPKYIMPEHVLYSYPADRQYNFYSKEHGDAYLLVEYDYSYLFTTEKPAGYDQKVRLKNFSGTTQAAPFRYTTSPATTDSRVQFELSVSLKDFTFKPDEIYTIAIINKPQKTVAQFDTNIDSTTTAVADNAKFDMQKTTRHAEGNMEVLDVTDIYTAHFRTSSYGTFSEKMDVGFLIENYDDAWCYGTIYRLIANFVEKTPKAEVFDGIEYNFDAPDNNLIEVRPDYSNTQWYTSTIAPLIYENDDLKNVIGEKTPPVGVAMAAIGMAEKKGVLSDNCIETGITTSRKKTGAFNNNISYFIGDDFNKIQRDLANNAIINRTVDGISNILKLECLPNLTEGVYPIITQYKLPGKNKTTCTKHINIEYKY